jgi:PAS domain S-box-containing protein
MRHRLPSSVARSRYQELLQSVYDAALITNVSGGILDANVRAIEFLQFEKAELCNMAVYDLIAGADESLMDSLCQNLTLERFTVIQAYCVRRDGTSFPTEIAVNKLRLDELCLCFFIRDTTLRSQAEQMLRVEHTAIQNAGNGIVIADLHATLEYANPAFARMVGVEAADALTGRNLREWEAEPGTVDAITQQLAGETNEVYELALWSESGEELVAQVAAACTRDADGEATGLVFSFADITVHRKAEQALLELQTSLEQLVAERTRDLEEARLSLQAELAATQASRDALLARAAELEQAAGGRAKG